MCIEELLTFFNDTATTEIYTVRPAAAVHKTHTWRIERSPLIDVPQSSGVAAGV
jgi:hypothetical protein